MKISCNYGQKTWPDLFPFSPEHFKGKRSFSLFLFFLFLSLSQHTHTHHISSRAQAGSSYLHATLKKALQTTCPHRLYSREVPISHPPSPPLSSPKKREKKKTHIAPPRHERPTTLILTQQAKCQPSTMLE